MQRNIMIGTADAEIAEAVPRHVLAAIDIAQIDQTGRYHELLQRAKIESAEFLPFGHDHQDIRPVSDLIGARAELDALEGRARGLHAGGVIEAYHRARILQRLDDRQSRRLSYI